MAELKLIAEPWDVGPYGYQLGNFPPGWAEWNGQYRDTVRRFWKGDDGTGRRARVARCRVRPTSSAIAADGHGPASISSPRMTASRCTDLVSYNEKHNEANGEDNRDGTTTNYSWNCGVEGPTDDPADPRRCATGRSATFWRPCCCRSGCRCCSPATRSGARSAATTTPIARTTRSPGSTGKISGRRRGAAPLRPLPGPSAPQPPGLLAAALLAR